MPGGNDTSWEAVGQARQATARGWTAGGGIGRSDPSLTGLAGLVCVEELTAWLGLVAELDAAIGPVKDRGRVHTAGQLLVGMAAGLLAGQDCLTGLDRVRAGAPVPAASTSAGLARRFDPQAQRSPAYG